MRYRAQLIGVPNLERTIQTHSNLLSAIDEWTERTLAKFPADVFPNAEIIVWETVEREVTRRTHRFRLEGAVSAQ